MAHPTKYEEFSSTLQLANRRRPGSDSMQSVRRGGSLGRCLTIGTICGILLAALTGCSILPKPDVIAPSTVDVPRKQLLPIVAAAHTSRIKSSHGPVKFVSSELPFRYERPRRLPTASQHSSSGETSLQLANDSGKDLLGDSSYVERLPAVHSQITFAGLLESQCEAIQNDHAEFYSGRGLQFLTLGFAAGAIMANTSFDEKIVRNSYIDNIVLAPEDDLYESLHQPKFVGEGKFTIPVFAAAALAEPLIDDLPGGPQVAEWGQRSFRTVLVGTPPMLSLQTMTGGSRPGESSASSDWKPFQDNNGVSGHSFMGAIPFMSAAKMTDNFWLKGGLYAASTLPAISRVNDDAHYFSQAFLGWWLAYASASAIDRSELLPDNVHMQPIVTDDTFGWIIQVSF